jgi:hypothetical protein
MIHSGFCPTSHNLTPSPNAREAFKAVYNVSIIDSPDTQKIYMVAVDDAPDGDMNLRLKAAGIMRGGRHHNYNVPYSQEIADKYTWAEDYEI